MANPTFTAAAPTRQAPPHTIILTQALPTPSTVSRVTIEAEHQAAQALARANQTQPPGTTSIIGIGRVILDGCYIDAIRTRTRTFWQVNGQPETKATVEALVHLNWQSEICRAFSTARERRLAAALDRSASRR